MSVETLSTPHCGSIRPILVFERQLVGALDAQLAGRDIELLVPEVVADPGVGLQVELIVSGATKSGLGQVGLFYRHEGGGAEEQTRIHQPWGPKHQGWDGPNHPVHLTSETTSPE